MKVLRYARIMDGVVREIIRLEVEDDQTINEFFHADIIAALVECTNEDVVQYWTYDGSEFHPPVIVEPEPIPNRIPVASFFERTTEDEADQIEEAMLAKPVKIRRAYQAAFYFLEGTDLWAALSEVLEELFGEDRRDELLDYPRPGEMRIV